MQLLYQITEALSYFINARLRGKVQCVERTAILQAKGSVGTAIGFRFAMAIFCRPASGLADAFPRAGVLEMGDFGLAHACEEIPGPVVGASMLGAKPIAIAIERTAARGPANTLFATAIGIALPGLPRLQRLSASQRKIVIVRYNRCHVDSFSLRPGSRADTTGGNLPYIVCFCLFGVQRIMEHNSVGVPVVDKRLQAKLEKALPGAEVEVVDDSESHRGHGGWKEGGGTHFRVRIVAPGFAGLSRLARHRLVYAALSEELAGSVHALSIQALAPGELG